MLTLRNSPSAADTDVQPRYDARQLVGAGNTATIVLEDQTYVLRITRAGKLILTK